MAIDYSEKLKDPRWQKKRLEIFQRDEWNCQKCHDGEATLHVHHKLYIPNKDPWDYPDDLLITLCESCHEYEKANIQRMSDHLLAQVQADFLSDDINCIAAGFYRMQLQHSHEVVADVIEWQLANSDLQRELIDKYFEQQKELLRKDLYG